eukprot:CAMPEP_0183322526 /NCGR_PEP_ID=MMETSP0160_2-20130417/71882_1 /TAXON_ID=2839 ORGANISM="Odontella Sinensis, Strain Grunow 1884" /NCGR_SAMPLE_ID=MMETSP0160_2 /ASSEMBLY_ACC=CAM_ASM_000250 /LENGTH=161 /DNA_ID=CAMNT_0025489709 /DNA_START=1 /DNA_END=486 /DNA_ORIENTATION=-
MTAAVEKTLSSGVLSAVLVASDLEQILDAAMCGVRVVGTALPATLARKSKALVVKLSGWDSPDGAAVNMEDEYKIIAGCISLDDNAFTRDASPLVEGCSCLACSNHTRAYIHHLINAHEILAEILLFIHNLHHLLKMFEQISHAAKVENTKTFQEFIEKQL